MARSASKAPEEKTSVWNVAIRRTKHNGDLEKQRDALIEHWGKHPHNWLAGEDLEEREVIPGVRSKRLIWTTLEASDDSKGEASLLPFPVDKEYVMRYVDILYRESEVLSDKARQMYVTTSTLQVIHWFNLFKHNRRWIWTKQNATESVGQLQDKVVKVHERLPQWVKDRLPIGGTQDVVKYPKTNSSLIAGAENVAIAAARGGSATGVGFDEGAFMDQFKQAWAAAAPMCGKIYGLTTPNIGTVSAKTYFDMLEKEDKRFVGVDDLSGKPVTGADLPPIEGFNVRRTSAGVVVVEIDLEADPAKRGNEEFFAWTRRRQPNEREWLREYRRNWTIAAGESFYPEWGNNGGEENYVQPIGALISGPVFRCWDFGYRKPGVVLFQVDPDTERVWVIRELLLGNINTWAFADIVLVACGQLGEDELPEETENDVRRWIDRLEADPRQLSLPWFGEGTYPDFVDLCGPEALKYNSHVDKESKENSDLEILEGRGITASVTSAQWQARENVMRKLMRLRPDGRPGLLVDPSCRIIKEALAGALCYALPSAANPLPDAPAKNGTHDNLHDALSYGVVQVIGLDEVLFKDGRNRGTRGGQAGRNAQIPAKSLFHEGRGDDMSGAFNQASRPRLGALYR